MSPVAKREATVLGVMMVVLSRLVSLQDVRSQQSIGIHCCTFNLTDEALDDPPRQLAKAAAAADLEPGSFQVLQHGCTLQMAQGVRLNTPPILT